MGPSGGCFETNSYNRSEQVNFTCHTYKICIKPVVNSKVAPPCVYNSCQEICSSDMDFREHLNYIFLHGPMNGIINKTLTRFSCLYWIDLEMDWKLPSIWSQITLFECIASISLKSNMSQKKISWFWTYSFHISWDQSTQIIILARRGGSCQHKMSTLPSDYKETWLKPHNPVKGNWLVNLNQYAWC